MDFEIVPVLNKVKHKTTVYDATEKKSIGIGQYVPLTEGRQILLDKGHGGRLVVVQLVNN